MHERAKDRRGAFGFKHRLLKESHRRDAREMDKFIKCVPELEVKFWKNHWEVMQSTESRRMDASSTPSNIKHRRQKCPRISSMRRLRIIKCPLKDPLTSMCRRHRPLQLWAQQSSKRWFETFPNPFLFRAIGSCQWLESVQHCDTTRRTSQKQPKTENTSSAYLLEWTMAQLSVTNRDWTSFRCSQYLKKPSPGS